MYWRKPNTEILYTSDGLPYEGYRIYAGDRQSVEDVSIPAPPDTENRWYFALNQEWTRVPEEVTFETLVMAGAIDLETAKSRLIEKAKNIAYQKTSIAFESQALGETHRYESAFIDQFNLVCNVVKAMTDNENVEHRCIRISDNKDDFFVHTPEQIKEVFRGGYRYILDHLKRLKVLMDEIKNAKTAEELLSIDLEEGW